jgi:hypothetical protein
MAKNKEEKEPELTESQKEFLERQKKTDQDNAKLLKESNEHLAKHEENKKQAEAQEQNENTSKT